MITALVKKQLLEIFRSYFVNGKTGKARSRNGIIGFFIFFAAMLVGLGFAFYSFAGALGAYILGVGKDWIFFAFMGLISIALGVFGSVFNTYASLYLPKDKEQLAAMPIPAGKLLISRLVGVYAMAFLYSAWVWIPTVIAYAVFLRPGFVAILYPALATPLIALFVSVLTCALGWVVALVASKSKGKSFLTVLLSLLVMGGYYFIYFKVSSSMQAIFEHIEIIGDAIQKWVHFIWLLGKASEGNIMWFLAFAGITLALFAVTFLIMARTYNAFSLQEVKTEKKAVTSADYQSIDYSKALLKREFKLFTSAPTWILNGGFGLLLMIVAPIVVAFKRATITQLIAELEENMISLGDALPFILLALVCMIISTDSITPASISIEGKQLWVLQSLPVDARDILRAKERVDVFISIIPILICTIACGFLLGLGFLEVLLVAVCTVFYEVISADLGLLLNLRFPNFTWTNVTSAVKQGIPVPIAMFGGWAFCAVAGAIGYFLCAVIPTVAVLGIVTAFFAIGMLAVHRLLMTKGAQMWSNL